MARDRAQQTTPAAAPVCEVTLPVLPTASEVRTAVAIISIDGLRPDAVLSAPASNILALAHRGSYSWRAQTILPSNTLPALFAGKEKFMHFRDSNCCDVWRYSAGGDQDLAAQAAMEAAGGIDLLVVHLPDVDNTGHADYWMSESYLRAVRRADEAVGRIVASLPSYTTIILTADHGGHPEGHGSADPLDTTIPWIIAGPTIAHGRELSSPIRTVDTAATAAYVLGIALPRNVNGQPVYEAFQ